MADKRHPLRVKTATFDRLKALAGERKKTLLETLEEVITKGMEGSSQTSAILGQSMLAVATFAKNTGRSVEEALQYIVKVSVGDGTGRDGRPAGEGGRLGALSSFNGKPAAKRRAKTAHPRRAA